MKQDNLEKFIKNNREEFDQAEPPKNIWDKVAVDLDKRQSLVMRVSWRNISIRIAAGVALLFGCYYLYTTAVVKQRIAEGNSIYDTSEDIIIPELVEAEAYYNGQINSKLKLVNHYSKTFPGVKDEVIYDLAELDSVCADLKRDLKDGIDDEEIVEALIQTYRLKLDILEEILNHLQEIKVDKNDKKDEYKI